MHKLWNGALQQTNNPDIGIKIGQQWSPTTFHALGYAWLASTSLHDALQRFNRYAAVINNGLMTDIYPQGTLLALKLNTASNPATIHRVGVDAGLSALVTMCKMLMGPSFAPVGLTIPGSTPLSPSVEALFANPVEYNATNSVFLVDARIARKTLLTGNETLAITNQNIANDYLTQLLKGDIELSASHLISQHLPTAKVNEQWLAEQLHMTIRTLRRKLSTHQTSFRQLINQTRKELAANYIRAGKISLIEVAYLLGFSDQANFSRAFKRWYDCSPTEYKAQLQQLKQRALK
jgi:AraC-like DNA-binding protein